MRERQLKFRELGQPMDSLTDILIDQFTTEQYHLMIRLYGLLCASHTKSLDIFKSLIKDTKFASLVASWDKEVRNKCPFTFTQPTTICCECSTKLYSKFLNFFAESSGKEKRTRMSPSRGAAHNEIPSLDRAHFKNESKRDSTREGPDTKGAWLLSRPHFQS